MDIFLAETFKGYYWIDLDWLCIRFEVNFFYGSVINQNGTSPSECWHALCRHTIGQLGLKWPKHYRCAWPLIHDLQTILIYFYFESRVAHETMCIATRVSQMTICIATCMYLEHASYLWETSISYMPFLKNTHMYLSSTLKNINCD